MRTVGAITIGQTPRADIAGEMQTLLGAGVRIVQAGALDGLTRAEIDALAPAPGDDDALIARLREGGEVLLAKVLLVPRLQACLDRLHGEADAFVILCAGAFPPFVREAQGAHFFDVDGHRYTDFCLGDTGAMTGHSPFATANGTGLFERSNSGDYRVAAAGN